MDALRADKVLWNESNMYVAFGEANGKTRRIDVVLLSWSRRAPTTHLVLQFVAHWIQQYNKVAI